jgi:PAS domain S-box-containing protein
MVFGNKSRTGLLGRLSHLIMFQSAFVFLAVVLVLFYPSRDVSTEEQTTRLRQLVRAVGDEVGSEVAGSRSDVAKTGVPQGEVLKGALAIGSACMLRLEDGRFTPVFQIERGRRIAQGAQIPAELAPCLDENLAHVISKESSGFTLATIETSTKALCYYRPTGPGTDSLVFVALVNHNLLIAARDEVSYLLLVLFMGSMLVSLLLVYLIGKKLRQPLAQVSRAIEKTAQGDSFYETTSSGDEDLTALTQSANRLGEALWSSREKVNQVSTRLEEANESLVQARLFVSALLDNSPLCIVVADPEGRILTINKEASNAFGVSVEEGLQKNIRDLLNLPVGQAGDLTLATHEFEAVGRKGADQSFPVYMVTSPLADSTGRIWARLYIVRDITESKSFQEMMIRLDRYSTRGEMAGEIAHEINNYLAVLSGNVELMPLLLKRGDQERITKKLDLMKTTVERIATFTDGLMCGGDEELRLDPCNLNQVIENVIAFLKPQNKFDTVEIVTSLSLDLPIVSADSGQIQQLLVNMINNAADSLLADKKKGRIEVRTLHTRGERGAVARLEIQDDGAGVQEDKVPYLFGKRFTTKRRGHGIGLVTCRKIVEAHSGQIGYEFREGAMFWIEIPVAARTSSEPIEVDSGRTQPIPTT